MFFQCPRQDSFGKVAVACYEPTRTVMPPPCFLIGGPFQRILIRLRFRRGSQDGAQIVSGQRQNAPCPLQHSADRLPRQQLGCVVRQSTPAFDRQTAGAMAHMVVTAGNCRRRNRSHHFPAAHPFNQFARCFLAGSFKRLRVTPIKQNILVQICVRNPILPSARRARRRA